MIRDHVRIDLDTYLVLTEDNNLGEAPMPLGGGERWYADDEVAARRDRAYQDLNAAGVFRRGRVSDEFMETVLVLHRPGVEHYTFAVIDGQPVTARASAIGKDAVLMVRSDDTLDLYPCEPDQLPQQLARSLPECTPATVQSLSCRYEDYQAANDGKPVPSGGSGRDAKQIVRWLNVEHTNFGELVTAIRVSNGAHRECEYTPRWIDTEQGRILVYLDTSGFLNLTTGSPDKIVGRLQQTENDLRGSSRPAGQHRR